MTPISHNVILNRLCHHTRAPEHGHYSTTAPQHPGRGGSIKGISFLVVSTRPGTLPHAPRIRASTTIKRPIALQNPVFSFCDRLKRLLEACLAGNHFLAEAICFQM